MQYIKREKVQVCYKCKESKPFSEFYEKGNRFINCSDCRSDRAAKRLAIQILLKKELN